MNARANGFTLLEVLVALTIAGILLVALMRAFSAAIDGSSQSEAVGEATGLAESALESIGSIAPLRDGANLARDVGRYQVKTSIRRYASAVAAGPATTPRVVPYEIAVTVSWRERAREHSVALRTLRLATPP